MATMSDYEHVKLIESDKTKSSKSNGKSQNGTLNAENLLTAGTSLITENTSNNSSNQSSSNGIPVTSKKLVTLL